jgi:chromosomal replication initiation ATPase DnaA
MNHLNGAPEAEEDVFGIVTAARERREKYARFIKRDVERTVADVIAQPELQAMIAKAVDERLKQEVMDIIARRAAVVAAEMEEGRPHIGPKIPVILKAVAEASGIGVGDLVGPRRARPIARPRQFAYHLLRTLRPDLSLPQIGYAIGNRDHTTIMHGLKAFARFRDTEEAKYWLAHPAIAELKGATNV